MTHLLYQVDAFTDEPFKGNPAAVCLLSKPESDAWLQAFAAEMNLSETAFLLSDGEGWHLRWFTPKTEVDLCGHATLASAAVLLNRLPNFQGRTIKFRTLSGQLNAYQTGQAITLDFPAMVYKPHTIVPKILDVFGFIPINAVFSGSYVLYEASSEKFIRQAQPDMEALAKLPLPEVIITAKSECPAFDFISRFFAPQLGIDEDPVTGSAHCLLAPYWAEKLGKKEFIAYQASQRGGELHLNLRADRVEITGYARILFKGEILI